MTNLNEISELTMDELEFVAGGEIVADWSVMGVGFGIGTTPGGGFWTSIDVPGKQVVTVHPA
jgi:hypothetical protein